MDIQRLNDIRHRLNNGGQLSVREIHDLLHEIEYLHQCREAIVHTLGQLTGHTQEAPCPTPT